MAHVLALRETCMRRRSLSLPTFLCFIDLKRAFDSVPHSALFDKLDALGVRGRFLSTLKSLYSNSSAVVRSGNVVSAPFPTCTGVRQGDPLSPLLFDLFINDLCACVRQFGVFVPNGESWWCRASCLLMTWCLFLIR